MKDNNVFQECGDFSCFESNRLISAPPAPAVLISQGLNDYTGGSVLSNNSHKKDTASSNAILHTGTSSEFDSNNIEVNPESQLVTSKAHTLVVRNRITKQHGISPAERNMFSEACHYLETTFPKKNIFLVLQPNEKGERETRKLCRKLKSDFGQLQLRAGFPRFYVEMLEAKNGVHCNIIGPLPMKYAERLYGYSYGSEIIVKRVYNMIGLRNYLFKEATPQAAYKQPFRRNKGSHQLGEGGGDRCRLSKALSEALSADGLILPYKRTYASRSLPKSNRLSKPAVFMSTEPTPVIVPTPIQLSLRLDCPKVNLMALIEAKRQNLHLPQSVVAQQLGGLKQPAYANALRGHDRLGLWRRNRALEWLAAA